MKDPFLPIEEAPFLRILLPFIAGILLQHFFPSLPVALLTGLAGILLLWRHYTARTPGERHKNRYAFGIAVFCLFTSAGMVVRFADRAEKEITLPVSQTCILAEIKEPVQVKERSVKAVARLYIPDNNTKALKETAAKAVLYLRPDENSRSLIPGNIIIFRQKLLLLSNRKNPGSFDYASYMQNKGIFYTQYLGAEEWKRIGYKDNDGLRGKASRIREQALGMIDDSGFSTPVQGILKALLLGYTQDITAEQKAGFSVAGLSHILAVSGLHTGVIVLFLYFMLTPLLWLGIPRIRSIVVLVLLWVYAFITGLSPSVVRACIMASFILCGHILGRKGFTLNSLFAAAFFMLLFRPGYLFDVSFQLSFIAVFSILYLYPLFRLPGSLKSRPVALLWDTIAVSAAAQIGTLPLIIYYFHQIPLLGLAGNIWVVPLLPFILGGGFIFLFLNITGIPSAWLKSFIEGLLGAVDRWTIEVSRLPFASVQHIWMEPHYLVFWFVLIFTAAWALRSKRSEILTSLLLFVLLFLSFDTPYRKEGIGNACIVFQDNRYTTINFITDGNNYLFSPDSISPDIEKTAGNFWIKNQLPNVYRITDSVNTAGLRISASHPVIRFHNNTILLLNSEIWKGKQAAGRLHIDYAIISKGYKGRLSDINRLFDINGIVLSADLNYFKRKSVLKECRELGLPCHDIKRDGAWILESELQ